MDLVRVCRLFGAGMVVFGLAAIAFPVSVADMFGLTIEQGHKIGYGEIGALYGGNFIGLGLVALYGARDDFEEGPFLLGAVATVWLAIALGRMAVMLARAGEASSLFGWLACGFELAVGLIFLFAARTRTRLP